MKAQLKELISFIDVNRERLREALNNGDTEAVFRFQLLLTHLHDCVFQLIKTEAASIRWFWLIADGRDYILTENELREWRRGASHADRECATITEIDETMIGMLGAELGLPKVSKRHGKAS